MDKVEDLKIHPGKPINLGSREFAENKYRYYEYLREKLPVARGKVSVVKLSMVSRYEDCLALTKDPRFGRNRSNITGGSRLPFPVPKSVALIALSMIVEDDPEHKRLRTLVRKAFTPRALELIETQVEQMAHRFIDELPAGETVDLQSSYALQIPTTVIGQLVGVDEQEMAPLQESFRVLTTGFSGPRILKTLFWDLRKSSAYMRELIAKKRAKPGDDILTGLIEAEEAGDRLTEDEIVSMLFLLIVAGYETTVHLITNGVLALLTHPEELGRLRQNPALYDSAVEEILRYNGPIHGTKMNYAREDLEICGTPISKGEAVVPLLGSANRDPAVFDDPDRFDITREPNKHLAFSQGNHFCLGAHLARMETRIALQTLFERFPGIELAVPESELKLQAMPLWHRYQKLPVRLRA